MTGETAGVAVVTGGAGGLGLACAHALGTRDPATAVVVADTSADRLDATVAELARSGVDALGLVADVTDAERMHEVAAEAARRGPLAVLVHAAGVWNVSLPGRVVFDVNYGGTVNVLDAFLPHATDGTAAVCLASIGGHRQAGIERLDRLLVDARGPGLWDALVAAFPVDVDPVTAYAAAKRGVMVECEIRSGEWGQRGARLLSVSPGNFDTEMGRQGRDTGAANHAIDAAMGQRPGRPEELAGVVAFLTSPAAGCITGIDLRVDRGAIANLRHAPAFADAFRAWDGLLLP